MTGIPSHESSPLPHPWQAYLPTKLHPYHTYDRHTFPRSLIPITPMTGLPSHEASPLPHPWQAYLPTKLHPYHTYDRHTFPRSFIPITPMTSLPSHEASPLPHPGQAYLPFLWSPHSYHPWQSQLPWISTPATPTPILPSPPPEVTTPATPAPVLPVVVVTVVLGHAIHTKGFCVHLPLFITGWPPRPERQTWGENEGDEWDTKRVKGIDRIKRMGWDWRRI